jgi:hypothetical protein
MLAPWPSDWFGLRGGVRVRVRVGRGRCVLGAGGELGVRGWGGMALIRKKHSAFSDPWASNKRCQPSNRHRATVRGVYGQWCEG